VTQQFSHWRVASAAVVFVLAGSSAVALAMHAQSTRATVAYSSWPKRASSHRTTAARPTQAARAGLRLMSQAATACRTTAFSAVLVSRWWGPAGARESRAQVWHRPGGQTVAEPVGGAPASSASRGGASDATPSVSVTISPEQFALLQSGYVLQDLGPGSADGRQAVIVAVDRPNGSLAARYWIDGSTKLPLRRQLFDDHARLVSDSSLTDLRVGPASLTGMPAAGTLPWNQQLSQPEVMNLRAQGWPLPVDLPGGLALFAASQTTSSSGPVVGLSYSDGLSVVSVFVQRGALPPALSGWRRIAVGGHEALTSDPDDQTIAWSGDGYVFAVVADAPSATVDQVIDALPHSPPDFWARLGRGFRRLATWANPFH
jgi:sigma-E factor negative regulatory protein RseB